MDPPPHADPIDLQVLGWVVAARMKGMASSDAAYASPNTSQRSILAHGFNEILAARRLKATSRSEEWADENLVETHGQDQYRAYGPADETDILGPWTLSPERI